MTRCWHLTILTLMLLLSSGVTKGQGIGPNERSFQKLKAYYEKQYEGQPVTGNLKRLKRAQHYLQSRLDQDGNLINHTRANLEALKQLYIDTFPATIQGDWSEIGPLNTIGTDFNGEGEGRVNCVAFASANTWYAGTAGGGLWRSDVGGLYLGAGPYPWYPLTDSLPVLSISGIAVHPDDVDDVYILTGDGDSRAWDRGVQPSIGILHSIDGGVSWDTTSLQYGVTQRQAGFKLLMHPESPDIMFAACTDALYKTTDGWNDPSFPNLITSIDTLCYDIEFRPGQPDTVYAACAGSLRRTYFGGTSFADITANLVQTNITPYSDMGRMAIAVTPDDPDVLYVIIAKKNGGLMSFQHSIDGGDSFIETIDNSYNILASKDHLMENDGQGNYDLALWADPNNAATVIVGGVNIWKSVAFGVAFSWARIFYWPDDEPPNYTHADIHQLKTTPTGKLVACTDGGLYQSGDGGVEWGKRSAGLGITQYYHFDVYSGFLGLPQYSGGAQDNGTSAGIGLGPQSFEMIGGGDGFRTYRGNADGTPVRYRASQNGKLYGQAYSSVTDWIEEEITPPSELDGDDKGMGSWDTPYQPNANNIGELIAGYDDLYYSSSSGNDWSPIAVNRPTGNYDATVLIEEMAWSKTNSNFLYFVIADTTYRDLWKCEGFIAGVLTGNLDAASCTVVRLDTVSIMPTSRPKYNSNPSDMALNPEDNAEMWISFPGFVDSMKVYYNQDMASDSSWINITYNLPNVPVLCVEYDVDGMYAGTDIGVFYLPHGEEEWIYFSQGLPTASVTEIEIDHTIAGKLVFASTWGRGIWWSTPPVPVRRTRWYVDSSATGINNGANWTNAFPDLQTALDTILPGDSIWVANGTYYPDVNTGFSLLRDNIRILGGFNGTEDSTSQRDWLVNETILSGDIGVKGDSLDNAHHVFKFGGHNANVLLDGFHITEGNAHGADELTKGAGIYYTTGTLSGKPIISNCRIYNNTAPFSSAGVGLGGGMYIADNATGDPEMYITNCTFENNHSGNRGGALYIDAYKWPSMPGTAVIHLDTCVFIENVAQSQGGAIYGEGDQNSSIKLFIDTTIFARNTLTSNGGAGGAIFLDAATNGHVELECKKTSFKNHSTPSFGGAVHIDASFTTSETVFINCDFDSCHANSGGGAIYLSSYGSSAISSLTIDGCSFSNNSNGGAINPPGGAVYVRGHTLAHNTISMNNSSFINNTAAGSGGAVQFNASDDGHIVATIDSCTFSNNFSSREGGAMLAYVRKKPGGTDPLGTIDLTISNTLFNNNTASNSAGALSLFSENANVNAHFTETDFINNTSNASDGGGAVYHHYSQNDTSSFTSSYSNCNFIGNSAIARWGGALHLKRTDVIFNACTFTENISRKGGAVYNINGAGSDTYAQTFNNCQFFRNKGTEFGGAIYTIHDDPAITLLTISNSLFDSNYTTLVNSNSTGKGGAIYIRGSGRAMLDINNTEFKDNYASKDGGAIYAGSGSGLPSPLDTLFMAVDSSLFINNDAAATGETVELYGNRLIIYSQWSHSNFFNDDASNMFLNWIEPGFGSSHATFNDCYIFLTGGPSPLAAAVPMEPELFEDQ